MLNFFGLYVDPVYVLILTVVIVSGFLLLLTKTMLDMGKLLKGSYEESKQTVELLKASLVELQESEASRAAKEAARALAAGITDDLAAKIADIQKAREAEHV